MKNAIGYFLVFIVAFCISMFYYNKILHDHQIIRIFELECIDYNFKIIK